MCDSGGDGIQQPLAVDQLMKARRDTSGQRTFTGFFGVIRGEDNDRKTDALLHKPRLDRKAVHFWHVNVEDDAVRLVGF